MKNALVVVAIGESKLIKTTLISLEAYSNKTNSDLIIIDRPLYSIKSKFNNKSKYPGAGKYNYLKFEKNQIYDLFENYDRVLRLDHDIIINPNAPDYFLLNDDYLYVTEEVGRSNEINQIKKDLGSVTSWNDFYFNGGVILASEKHKEVFNIDDIDFDLDLGLLKEQNVLNWKVNKLGVKVKNLGPSFNFFAGAYIDGVRFNDFNNNQLRRAAHFIHYAGQKNRLAGVKRDVAHFFDKNYTDESNLI